MLAKGKVIVVTGAGNGIGREVTLLLLRKGARVAAVDLRNDFLAETKALATGYSDALSLHAVDISNKDEVKSLPAQIIAAHHHIDGLLNIAGIIQPFVKIHELDDAIIEKVMHVNFYGTLYMVRSFLPYLMQRPEAHVLNVSSMGGFLPVPGQSIYGASKAAVKLFTEALSAEMQGTSVGVTIVFPGGVATQITKNSNVEIKIDASMQAKAKVLSPQKAAELMVEAMEKNKFRAVIGSDARFMDKLYRLAPEYAKNFISKQMRFLLDRK